MEKRQSAVRILVARESAVLLKDLWQARNCCLESSWYRTFDGCFGIAGRQACWLAWANLSLRPPLLLLSFSFFSLFLVFVVSDSVGEP